jgi:ubiquinone/menaquinone biosynthesis C-methylase UbiE
MFFAERIRGIRPGDRVLEVGPGGSPHPRSDVLLDVHIEDAEVAREQRGNTPPARTSKPVAHFDGLRFPFADRAFDYVICSHVLEHVEDVPGFVAELFRVAASGYIEYPTIYYEYLYNFRVHRSVLKLRAGRLVYLPKAELGLEEFGSVHAFFLEALVRGYSSLVDGSPSERRLFEVWMRMFRTQVEATWAS